MEDVWHAFLRLFFRLLYNQFAWGYDFVAWLVSLGRWRAWGRTVLPHVQGERVLELGHGPGHLLIPLAERGLATVGLDLSPHMARQARRRLRGSDRAVSLVIARAQALPFRRRGFDSVVATFPTDFIVHPRTLSETERVLAPHGRFVVALAARFKGEGLLSRFLTWLYFVTGQTQPSPESYLRGFEQAGLCARVSWERVNQTAVMVVIAERG